jgi:twinkle protein
MMTFSNETVDFQRYMKESEPIAKVLPAAAWLEEIDDVLKNGNVIHGAKMPWAKTWDDIRFRPGEVSVWGGINGHGKSQVLGQVCLGFISQGQGVCIASFEMKPVSTFMRLLRQSARCSNPSIEFSHKLIDWLEDKFWIYDHIGSVTPEQVFAAIRYAAIEKKVDHFVVDNLMKCVRAEDDYSGQKYFIDRITSLAREHNIHIHVVHHVRKGDNEESIPGKFDSRGSSTIVDQIDNYLTVWRNKAKERKLQRNPNDAEWQDKPDAIISVDKHRHGEWEGRIGLWFHKDSLQYTPDPRNIPLDMTGGQL